MYYTINENLARQSHDMMSFSDYKEGSLTQEYQSEVNEIFNMIQSYENKADKDDIARAYDMLNHYAKVLADYYNKESEIGCRCPSVMISGGSNFPVHKKEKQIEAWRRNHEFYQTEIKDYPRKIENVLRGKSPIQSDDPRAVERLQKQLEDARHLQKVMVSVNAYYRKYKTVKGCTELTEKQIAAFESNKYKIPFPGFELSLNNAKIHRIEKRIEQISELHNTESNESELPKIDGCKIVRNTEIMRLQIIFDSIPEPEIREKLKNHGFRWSPHYKAWQRQLTLNAERAVKSVFD